MKTSESYRKNLIAGWQSAYEAANGTVAPTVRYENGFFVIDNAGRYRKIRRTRFEEMRDELARRSLVRT
jgi:hypothetical protein